MKATLQMLPHCFQMLLHFQSANIRWISTQTVIKQTPVGLSQGLPDRLAPFIEIEENEMDNNGHCFSILLSDDTCTCNFHEAAL